jgi:hypothetical protein
VQSNQPSRETLTLRVDRRPIVSLPPNWKVSQSFFHHQQLTVGLIVNNHQCRDTEHDGVLT